MKQKLSVFFIFTALWAGLSAQDLNNVSLKEIQKPQVRKTIQLPDIPGYVTLKCDFHTHTMFSDGLVWPTIRVDEAYRDGLDAIAITDHIEYIPHKEFLASDHNSSYEIAKPYADEKGILLIRAGEITRNMPPGHLNGLFLEDVNALDTPDVEDALQAVVDQGGFVFWNHPGWKAQQPDTTKWWDMHTQLLEKGLIHGIEVFNWIEYYPIAIDWCLKKDLAMIGNSDIHELISDAYDIENAHRPATLVFAKDKSVESIREAMFANRTAAWFDGKMIGREEHLKAFFLASLEILEAEKKEGVFQMKIKNTADMPYILIDTKGKEIKIHPLSEANFEISADVQNIEILNLLTGMEENLRIALDEFVSL